MFRLIVDMMSYSRQLGVETDVETTSKLATCRLALIRSGLEEARLATATKDRVRRERVGLYFSFLLGRLIERSLADRRVSCRSL